MILIPWAASAEQVRQREHELRTVAERRRRTTPGGGSGRVTVIALASS